MDRDHVPCRFCHRPTPMTATRLCNGCWRVDLGLDEFVRTVAGRDRVLRALGRRSEPAPLAWLPTRAELDNLNAKLAANYAARAGKP